MSEENVEIVKRAIELWNRNGADAAKELWAKEIEWRDLPNLPDPQVVRGRDAVAANLTEQVNAVGDLDMTIVDARTREDTVVLRVEVTIHGAESGVDVPGEMAQVIQVTDGRLQRARLFGTWGEALEAAGLSE